MGLMTFGAVFVLGDGLPTPATAKVGGDPVALFALACDLAQYGSMYWYMRAFQRKLDGEIKDIRDEKPAFDPKTLLRDYDESDPRFLAGRIFFGLKTMILLAAVFWLAIDAYVLLWQSGK